MGGKSGNVGFKTLRLHRPAHANLWKFGASLPAPSSLCLWPTWRERLQEVCLKASPVRNEQPFCPGNFPSDSLLVTNTPPRQGALEICQVHLFGWEAESKDPWAGSKVALLNPVCWYRALIACGPPHGMGDCRKFAWGHHPSSMSSLFVMPICPLGWQKGLLRFPLVFAADASTVWCRCASLTCWEGNEPFMYWLNSDNSGPFAFVSE